MTRPYGGSEPLASHFGLERSEAAELLGLDCERLGAALRRRTVRVLHPGRESLHKARGDFSGEEGEERGRGGREGKRGF